MKGTNLQQGTYAIISVWGPRWAVDTKKGAIVVNPYIGSKSQQWNLESTDGIFWYIQNVASGHYLGLHIDEQVEYSVHLSEVKQRFAWHIRSYEGRQDQFVPYVPYTKYVIDLSPKDPQPGRHLYIWGDNKGSNQAWHLCKDLHLETSSVLKDGSIYKIINSQSKTAITIKDDDEAACFQSDDREGQMFKALETANGWAFRSIKNQRYLGIPHTIVGPDDAPCLSSVEKEFTWMVLPNHEGSRKSKIWIPFTCKLLDLHQGQAKDDTPVRILGTLSVEWIWWRFEEAAARGNKPGLEGVTGERDA